MSSNESIVTSAADCRGKLEFIRPAGNTVRSPREQKGFHMCLKGLPRSPGLSLAAAALAAVIGLICAPAARASLEVYEPFNYAAGSTLDSQGNNSDVGFAGGSTWQNGGGSSGTNTIVGPGLTYTDANGNSLAVSGDAAYIANSSTANETDYRNLSATYGTAGQTLWISLLGQGSTANSWAGLSLINTNISGGNQEVLFLGQSGTDWEFVDYPTPTGGGVGGDSGSLAANKAFLVYQVVVGASTGYTINTWVNPLLGTSLPATPNATYTNTADTFSQFNQFVLHSGTPATLDEIRIGTSYTDVAPIASSVPEPATLSLLGIGEMALAIGMCLRKRRSSC